MLTESKQPRHMFEVYPTLTIETCVCIVLCVNPLYAQHLLVPKATRFS